MGKTVSIISIGEMGLGIGTALKNSGVDVATCVGRSKETQDRARSIGVSLLPDLKAVVYESELILSIVPPSAAIGVAESISKVMRKTANPPVFLECNAISPRKSVQISKFFERYIDAGIIGPPDNPSIYCSGVDLSPLDQLPLKTISMGTEVGAASEIKLMYSAINKGINALLVNIIRTSKKNMNVLKEEFRNRRPPVYELINTVENLPLKTRWASEMEEIADMLNGVAVTDFYYGAKNVYKPDRQALSGGQSK